MAQDIQTPAVLPPASRRRWITFGVMMGVCLGALEATVVVTAMPRVVSSLGGLELYSWVYSTYFLTSTVTVPLWGRLSDLYGRRWFYLAGLGFFVGGSVLCGLSLTISQLIGFRALQGLGAGALIPLGRTIIGDIYPLEQRGRVQGLFSAVWGLSSIVGPLLGGLITDHLSWRWVFFLNLPFGFLSGLIVLFVLREPRQHGSQKIDFLGAGLLMLAVSLLLYSLDRMGELQEEPALLLMLLGSFLLLGLFALVETRAADPILPLVLFRDRIFSSASLNGFFSGMALFGAITFIPLYVQGVLGTSATQAGWTLTPLILGWVVFSVASGRLILVVSYRLLVVTGMICLTFGFFLLIWQARATPPLVTLSMAFIGIGMGLSVVSLLLAVQNRFPRHFLGIATSATQFFRSIGAAVGIALMGAVMGAHLEGSLALVEDAHLQDLAAHPDRLLQPDARAQLSPAALNLLQSLLGEALRAVFFTGLLVSVVALISAFLVPKGSAREHALR